MKINELEIEDFAKMRQALLALVQVDDPDTVEHCVIAIRPGRIMRSIGRYPELEPEIGDDFIHFCNTGKFPHKTLTRDVWSR